VTAEMTFLHTLEMGMQSCLFTKETRAYAKGLCNAALWEVFVWLGTEIAKGMGLDRK
jgi:hypothetical protein